MVPSGALRDALLRIGQHVADNGVVGDGPYGTARDLLLREPPRLGDGPVREPGETPLDTALRIAHGASFGVLPIQGPPGAGKTFTAARMICELVDKGARVGITANSHKVIVNLLDAALAAAEERGLDVRAVRKVSGDWPGESDDDRVVLERDNASVFAELAGDCQVGAGTAWLWAREEARDTVDVLFVDEAAQMSLANVLAISHAGPNLVLLGDPQQLDQPIQGTHPDGTGVSALAHLLGGPPDHRGVPGPVPRRDVAAPSRYLRLHLRGYSTKTSSSPVPVSKGRGSSHRDPCLGSGSASCR